MKHLKLFFALFAMLALGVGNAWGAEYTKVTATNTLSNGDLVIIAMEDAGIPATGVSGGVIQSSTTTKKDATVTTIESDWMIFTVTTTTDGWYLSNNSSQFIGKPGANTFYLTTSESAKGICSVNDDGVLKCNDRFLCKNNTNYRMYSSVGSYVPFYVYKVVAGGGETPDPTPSKLSTPANLKEASIAETSATLSWDAVANASNYSVTINGNTETVTTNSYSATGLTAGTEYTWSVVAKGDGTNYTDSEAAQHTFTTNAASTPDAGGESTGTATLTFDNVSKRTTFTTLQQVWTENGVTLTNDKASSTSNVADYCNPARFYKNSKITITHTSNKITQIVFDCKSPSYATALQSAIGNSAAISDDKVTVNITPATESYVINTLSGGQVQMDALTVTYETSGSGSTEPVLSVTPTEVDFGTVYQGATVEAKTVAVNFSNLTGAVTYNGLESTPFTATGSISATGDKITIAADASTINEYSQTLTVVSAADNKTAEVTVTMKVVEAPAPTGTFELYSGELTEGDYVIYYNGSAMKAEVASSRLSYVEVAPTDNKIENPDAATIWHIAQSGTNWTIYNNDKGYAAGNGTKNQAQLLSQEAITTGTSAADNLKKASWIVTGTETYDFVNVFNSTKDTPVNANLRNNVNNGTNYGFACYGTSTGGALTLYKKSDGKQAAGLAYATDKYLVKFGDEFTAPELTNPKTLTVTYGSSNEDVATVDATTGAITVKAVGYATITASFAGTEEIREGSAKYTICVTEHAGTKADPYTVAEAKQIIDALETATSVCVEGVVSQVDSYSEIYYSITYWISTDGTTTNQLQVYGGLAGDVFKPEKENFASMDDLKNGDKVVVQGDLKIYDSTYEFDLNSKLISHKRDLLQPGLAYATDKVSVKLGESFTAPELTNEHNLQVTYTSSNETVATVDANTGAVTINAVGVATITASFGGNDTYAIGSASYTITVTGVASLPFYFDGKRADIEGTAGMTQSNLGTDYADAPYLKFNAQGAWAIVQFDSEPGEFSFLLEQNGESIGTFTVYESENGEDYTPIWSGGDLGGNAKTIEPTLSATARYVKFEYTTKPTGTNYGLGEISIKKADHRQEASLVWNPSAVTLTQGEAFTAPTLNNPYSVAGITYESSNDEVATVTTEGEIALATGIGTATITATFAGDATYKPAEVTCVITVNEYIETIDGEWQLVTDASKLQAGMEIIIASVEVDGKYYAMSKASDNGNNRTAVESTISGDKLNPALGTSVLTLVDAGNGTFALQAGNGNYLYAASGGSNHLKEKDEIDVNGQWTITIADNVATIKAEGSSNRNWIRYNSTSKIFSCYASGQKDIALYAKVPDCTREIPVGYYGTVCLPSNIIKVLGATLYEVAGKEDNGRVVFDEVLAPVAGMPYIFLSHNAEVLFYCGTETATEAGKHNSLQGTFNQIDPAVDNILVGNYMVVNNVIKKCGANCGMKANRAYFIATELESLGAAPQPMPGRRRVTMGVTGENEATGVDNITENGVIAPKKLIENGQLIIIRDGVKYNVQGVRL